MQKSMESRTVVDCITIGNAFQVFYALIHFFYNSLDALEIYSLENVASAMKELIFYFGEDVYKMEINFVTLFAFSLVCSRSIINLKRDGFAFLFSSECIETSLLIFLFERDKKFLRQYIFKMILSTALYLLYTRTNLFLPNSTKLRFSTVHIL